MSLTLNTTGLGAEVTVQFCTFAAALSLPLIDKPSGMHSLPRASVPANR
jgi:hypothetical protein